MKKHVIRIAVTVLTFSLGILAAALFTSRHSRPEEDTLYPVAATAKVVANKRPTNEAWSHQV